jgi:hypothetical protein
MKHTTIKRRVSQVSRLRPEESSKPEEVKNSKTLADITQFDESIRIRVERLQQTPSCIWCKDPRYVIHNKSTQLCSSCYRWYKKHKKLSDDLGQLPPECRNDPYWQLRSEFGVVKQAIELCKGDGNVREANMNQVESIDLEYIFEGLSKEVLGKHRGLNFFHGKVEDFSLFSSAQRVWIWHLLFSILSERNRQKRGSRAFSHYLQSKK